MIEKVAESMEKVMEGSSTYQGDNLFEAGILDSLSVVDLAFELEEAFDIEIDSEYITENNFKTKEATAKLVSKLLSEEGREQV